MQVSNYANTIAYPPAEYTQPHRAEGMSTITKVLIVALSILLPALAVACLGFIPVVFNAVGLAGLAGLSFSAAALGACGATIGITKCRQSPQTPPELIHRPTVISASVLMPQTISQKAPSPPVSSFAQKVSVLLDEGFVLLNAKNETPEKISDSKKMEARDSIMREVTDRITAALKGKTNYFNAHRGTPQEIKDNFLKMASELAQKGISYPFKYMHAWEKDYLKTIKLHISTDSPRPHGVTKLFGRYDILATPCELRMDSKWDFLTSGSPFMVYHAAAPNIGKASDEDFDEFKLPSGGLNESGYLHAMQDLFTHLMHAQINADHNVWTPFGMDDSLRDLEKNDPSYDQSKSTNLRERIARRFVKALNHYYEKHPIPIIHLCLSTESCNYEPFAKALLLASPDVKKALRLHLNVDAADVAHNLAETNKPNSVSLVNATNRNLLGGQWFEDGALDSQDESLHRRSSQLAKISLLLNGGAHIKNRPEDELQNSIKILGGSSSWLIP